MKKPPRIEIIPHPDEVIDLDDETVAIARAKLAGVDFTDIFGDEDRTSPELLARIQAERIRVLFRSPDELKEAFSSPQRIEEAKKDMLIDCIDLEFVKSYCSKQQIEFQDDAEALLKIAFSNEPSGVANV